MHTLKNKQTISIFWLLLKENSTLICIHMLKKKLPLKKRIFDLKLFLNLKQKIDPFSGTFDLLVVFKFSCFVLQIKNILHTINLDSPKRATNQIPLTNAQKSVVVLGFSFALLPAFERRLLSLACVVVRQAKPSHAQRQNQSGVLLLAACAERIQSLRSGDAASRIFALSTEIRINAVNTRCCYYHKKPCDKIKDCALCRLFAAVEGEAETKSGPQMPWANVKN
jgi:hypothetical protein